MVMTSCAQSKAGRFSRLCARARGTHLEPTTRTLVLVVAVDSKITLKPALTNLGNHGLRRDGALLDLQRAACGSA